MLTLGFQVPGWALELTPPGFTAVLSSPVVFGHCPRRVCLHLRSLKVPRCDLYLLLFIFIFLPIIQRGYFLKNIHMYTPTTSTLGETWSEVLREFMLLIWSLRACWEPVARSASGCGKKSLCLGECRKQVERWGEHREREQRKTIWGVRRGFKLLIWSSTYF